MWPLELVYALDLFLELVRAALFLALFALFVLRFLFPQFLFLRFVFLGFPFPPALVRGALRRRVLSPLLLSQLATGRTRGRCRPRYYWSCRQDAYS